MRKICVFIGGRANYSSAKPIMKAIQKEQRLQLQTIIAASALLNKFGNLEKTVTNDGFKIDAKLFMIVEGENPVTMAKSTGIGISDITTIFDNLKPDMVLVIGDRFDVLAPVIAASCMNIPIAHTMGGEISGTIDESIRHAITKMSHIHFPANDDAYKRIIKLGEDPAMVFNVGCPRMDLVKEYLDENHNGNGIDQDLFFSKYKGVGGHFDIERDKFLIVSQHPVTTEYGANRAHVEETLSALNQLKMPTIMIWPNADAGSDEISKGIRTFREKYKPDWLHVFVNLPIDIYVKLMDMAACIVGNSSSGLRDGAFIGIPAVNIGSRQAGRLRGDNVMDAKNERDDILDCIQKQLENGKYSPSTIYGDGKSGEKIVRILNGLKEIPLQKRIHY